MSTADRFREIDAQAADVRRKLDVEGYTPAVRGDLFGLQRLAQNGLRDAIADQPKLAVYNKLLDVAWEAHKTMSVLICEHDDFRVMTEGAWAKLRTAQWQLYTTLASAPGLDTGEPT